MNISVIQNAAREYGISKLSKQTGLARSYLYKVIEGSSSPTLDAFEKITTALGFSFELHRWPIENSVLDVSLRVTQDGQWKIHFFNFVDAFRRTKKRDLIESPPTESLGEKEQALLASIVFELCRENRASLPDWVKNVKPLEEPWFVAGMESLKAMAIVESPIGFRKNNIFVFENFLSRA